MMIPLSPLPFPVLQKVSRMFVPVGWRLKKMFPNLEIQLGQSDINIEPREYLAMMAFLTLFYLIFFTALITLILSRFMEQFLVLGVTVGIIVSFLVLVQLSMFPMMRIRKKQRDLEKNLLFALRTMLIEIKSGVTLFDAMELISKSNYGKLSAEFKKAVDEINTGAIYDEALQRLATNNPSPYFRKALWQIITGMKSGGDMASIIRETVVSAARDQRIAINKYSAQLRLLSLAYMMIGVIMPALGLTFLIVIGSFPQLEIGEPIFWILLGAIIIMQFMYIGVIKSRRPTIMA